MFRPGVAPLGPKPARPGLVSFARDPSTRIATSRFCQTADTLKNLVDGKIERRWITQREGEKWVEFTFPEDRVIGCIQFLNGWTENGTWKAMVDNYRLSCHNGVKWVELAVFDVMDGAYNFARDYQIFGLDWSERELGFYLNGKEIRREETNTPTAPLRFGSTWRLSRGAEKSPTPFTASRWRLTACASTAANHENIFALASPARPGLALCRTGFPGGSLSNIQVERPALLFDEPGRPIALFGATDGYRKDGRTSFNVHFPLTAAK